MDTGSLRVLVIDDCADTAQSTALLLSYWGHAAATAINADEALAAARKHRPDVVLLDIILPNANGLDLAETLCVETGLTAEQFIVITGFHDAALRERCRKQGLQHLLLKPVNPQELHLLLSTWPTAATVC